MNFLQKDCCGTCSNFLYACQNECCLTGVFHFCDRMPNSLCCCTDCRKIKEDRKPFSLTTLPEVLEFKECFSNDLNDLRVIARVQLPTRTIFGPLVAPLLPRTAEFSTRFSVKSEEGGWLDYSLGPDHLCNWMKFVRLADNSHQQNLTAFQMKGEIYFAVIKEIQSNEELVVYYAWNYANDLGKPLFPPPDLNPWDLRLLENNASSMVTSEETDVNQIQVKLELELDFNLTATVEKETYKSDFVHMEKSQDDCKTESGEAPDSVDDKVMENDEMLGDAEGGYFKKSSANEIEEHMSAGNKSSGGKAEKKSKQKDKKSINRKCSVEKSGIKKSGKSSKHAKKLQCVICDLMFESSLQAQEHRKSTHINTEGRFSCSECSNHYGLFDTLLSHWRRFHFEPSKLCEICGKKQAGVAELNEHYLTHPVQNGKNLPRRESWILWDRFKCDICGKPHRDQSKMKEHMAVHTKGTLKYELSTLSDKFKCDICGKPNKDRSKLNRHKATHTKEKSTKIAFKQLNVKDYHDFVYKCRICRVGFCRRGLLVDHMNYSHPDVSLSTVPELNFPIRQITSHKCLPCETRFFTETDFLKHIQKCHRDLEESVDGAEVIRMASEKKILKIQPYDAHSCQECGFLAWGPNPFLQHVQAKHPGYLSALIQMPTESAEEQPPGDLSEIEEQIFEDDLACSLCQITCISQEGLRSHYRTHFSSQQYTCSLCDRKFDHLHDAKSHSHKQSYGMYSRNREKVTCETCGITVKGSHSLNRHMKLHSSPNFKCEQCGNAFFTGDRLRRHVRRVHEGIIDPEPKLQCGFCEASFRPDKLHRHIAKAHEATGDFVTKKTRINRRHKKSTYRCLSCNISFTLREKMVLHMRREHPDIPLSSIPELNYPTKMAVKYFCVPCDVSSFTEADYLRHLAKKHSDDEELIEAGPGALAVAETRRILRMRDYLAHWCPQCDLYFGGAKLFEFHARKKHPEYLHAE